MRIDSYQVVFRFKRDPDTLIKDQMKDIEERLKMAFPDFRVELVEISMRPNYVDPIASDNPAPTLLRRPKRRSAA